MCISTARSCRKGCYVQNRRSVSRGVLHQVGCTPALRSYWHGCLQVTRRSRWCVGCFEEINMMSSKQGSESWLEGCSTLRIRAGIKYGKQVHS